MRGDNPRYINKNIKKLNGLFEIKVPNTDSRKTCMVVAECVFKFDRTRMQTPECMEAQKAIIAFASQHRLQTAAILV